MMYITSHKCQKYIGFQVINLLYIQKVSFYNTKKYLNINDVFLIKSRVNYIFGPYGLSYITLLVPILK